MRKLIMLAGALAGAPAAAAQAGFRLEEATITDLHAALAAGTVTCRGLVERYLARIAAYDQNGPALNAIVSINPHALAVADSLDRRFRTGGPVGPLHCVPMIVKENFETTELPVTAG
ncbi:MAG: amidase family protein, partial [Gemmatimonadales bacterium]|nr:amidase family protein [Gemmatimonadales bacterium]